MRSPLRLNGFEFLHFFPPARVPFVEHRHRRAHMVMVFSGAWADRSGGRTLNVGSGEVLFHPARFVHASRAGAPGTEVIIVRVEPAIVTTFCPLYGNVARDVQLPFETLRGVPDRIREELTGPDAAAPLILESLAMELMALGSRIPDAAAYMPPPWMSAVVALIDRSFAERLTVRAIAARVGISPSRLAHVFGQVMRRSVTAYLRERRVRAAARSLRESTLSIADIAHACGFYDQAHLARSFKALRNMTPRQYRQAYRLR